MGDGVCISIVYVYVHNVCDGVHVYHANAWLFERHSVDRAQQALTA